MRRAFNWMVFFGIIIFVGGIAFVLMVIYKNLPSPFDIVDATEKDDISLPIISPGSSVWHIDTLHPILLFSPSMISSGNNALMNSGEDSVIPTTTPVAAPSVIFNVDNTSVTVNEASEILNTSPAITPTAISGESDPPAVTNNLPDPTPAAGSVYNSDENYSIPSIPQSQPIGMIPDRLVISVINLDASIIPVDYKKIEVGDQVYYQWLTPEQFAVGWHASSAFLGQPGNIVLNGHHNAYGKVFKDLVTLKVGDAISVYSGFQEFQYQVVANMLFPEQFESISTRMENALWIGPSSDERLTLITCWPADSNTHRVIIVAKPVGISGFTSVP